MESPKDRLDNLCMFLHELIESEFSSQEIKDQANYHLATIDLLLKSELSKQ